jgi:hypothetical protein
MSRDAQPSAPTSVTSRPRVLAGRALEQLPARGDLTVGAIREGVTREHAAAKGETGRGPSGNARLTATTGVVLLVLFALEGITLVSLHPLLTMHVVVGMLLIPPVALKLGSTGYRFTRYYTGHRAYRLAGPPQALMRALGPLVVAATAALLGSGVAMLALGPGRGWVVGLHKAAFVAWIAVTAAHVLGHVLRVPGFAAADFTAPRGNRRGAGRRRAVVATSLVAGLVLALLALQYVDPWRAVTGG